MRVVQFGPYPPPHGGVQSNIAALHRHLRELGIDSRVVNMGYSDFKGTRAPVAGVSYPRSRLSLLRHAIFARTDVVHVHVGGGLHPPLVLFLLLCTIVPGRRTVLTFHSGGYPSSPEGRGATAKSLLGFILRRFHHVIAVNQEIASMFAAFGVARDRITVIPPGAVLPGDDEGDEVAARDLHRFADSQDPLLMTIGLLEPEYDLSRQIEMLERLADHYPKAGLLIVGSGSLEPDLRKRIAASPVRDRIRLAGDVPHSTTIQLLQRATLFLRTTHYDGDAISVREALAVGIPVIATDNGMRPDGVRLCQIADSSSLLDATLAALKDSSQQYRPMPSAAAAGVDGLKRVTDIYRALTDKIGDRSQSGVNTGQAEQLR